MVEWLATGGAATDVFGDHTGEVATTLGGIAAALASVKWGPVLVRFVMALRNGGKASEPKERIDDRAIGPRTAIELATLGSERRKEIYDRIVALEKEVSAMAEHLKEEDRRLAEIDEELETQRKRYHDGLVPSIAGVQRDLIRVEERQTAMGETMREIRADLKRVLDALSKTG